MGPYGFPVCGSSNVHAQSPVWDTDMRFLAWSFLKSANSKGSGETALMRKLAWAFAGHYVVNPFSYILA